MTVKIKSAAIRTADGNVHVGRDHGEIYKNITPEDISIDECGFVTEQGRFVGRKEAAEIAYAAGQIPEPTTALFSEDLTSDRPWEKKK